MNEVLKVTIEALALALLTILPVLAKYLVNLITVKIDGLKKQTANEQEQRILASIDQTITDSVNYVSQTFVDALKADGEFSVENQKAALSIALGNIKDTLSEESKEFIMSNYGDLTSWLTTKIESTIQNKK